MRKVASYSLTSGNLSVNDAQSRVESVQSLVQRWMSDKGRIVESDEGTILEFPDGRHAELQRRSMECTFGELHHTTLVEPTESGLFSTTIVVGRHEDSVGTHIELRAGSEAYQVAPIRLDVRCPRLVRSILDGGGEWFVGEVPVTTDPIQLSGLDGGRWLTNVLWHSSRNLPVIVVSTYNKQAFSDSFTRDLARDVSALAIVVEIDGDCSWALTSEKGKEWSCYNGAIRLYWPVHSGLDRPNAHPLWTLPRILAGTPSRPEAAARMRRQLRRRILGLSAFTLPEPAVLRKIRTAARREHAEKLKATAAEDIEWQNLAEEYSVDNDELRSRVDDLELQVEDLQIQNTNLRAALAWQQEEDEISPETSTPPATVADAVGQAREAFSDWLIFGDDVNDGVAGLAPEAGPPEKIFSYFSRLAEMTTEMSSGSIGTSAIDWLRQRGVDASTESETIKSSAVEMQKRIWHDGTSDRQFHFHLKPTDATSPDRCVRIYYEYEPQIEKIIVGWVGRHP